MSNQQIPKYIHLKMREMEVIRPEPVEVTLATQRILDLDSLETQRGIDRPELLTAITRQELEQFKRDARVLARRYDGFVASFTKDLLTSHTDLPASALVFADNASLAPDAVDCVAYYYFYHDQDVLADPPSHAVAVFARDRASNTDIPVFPIHEEHFVAMLKRFPRLPANPYPVDTNEIEEPHPNYLDAEMRTEGDIPMVELSVTTTEAFSTIRHWVYTQEQHSLVKALLGEQLAASVDPGVFSINEPAFGSLEFFNECYEASSLSVASDSLEPSALTEAEDRVTEIIDLAINWELINDDFWAVVLTLERIIPVARKFSRSVSNADD